MRSRAGGDDVCVRRKRRPPLWEREAPLTPERAAEILKKVRVSYSIMVASFWVPCIALAFLLHSPVGVVAVIIVAVLNAGTMWWAFRDARAGIRRNTTMETPDRLDVGL